MAPKIIGEETPESAAIKKHCGNLKNHQNMPKKIAKKSLAQLSIFLYDNLKIHNPGFVFRHK